MHRFLAEIVAGLILVGSALHAVAQSAPTLGLLYNTQEGHSLTYQCGAVRAGELNCEFVQAAVRLKTTAEGAATAIEQARKQYKSEKPVSQQECSTYRDMLPILEGKKAAPKPEGLALMTPIDRADALRFAQAFAAYCDKPTEESFLAIVRLGQDKDRRTCSVSSNSFAQSFRLAPQSNSRPVWVAQGNPEGVCGTVQLSRFESEEIAIGSSKFLNWKYVARKAVTNPSREIFPGTKCSGLDETPYTYDWRSKEHQMSCDYIQFSPL